MRPQSHFNLVLLFLIISLEILLVSGGSITVSYERWRDCKNDVVSELELGGDKRKFIVERFLDDLITKDKKKDTSPCRKFKNFFA